MTNKNPVNVAAGMSQALFDRGLKIFDNVNYTINGSCELANAYLSFALQDGASNAQFMAASSLFDITRLPIMVRHQCDPSSALLIAQRVQLLLFMLASDINSVVIGKPAVIIEAQLPGESALRPRPTAKPEGATPKAFDLDADFTFDD